jgi:hypothetical protein
VKHLGLLGYSAFAFVAVAIIYGGWVLFGFLRYPVRISVKRHYALKPDRRELMPEGEEKD